jgi:hypothetical protein
MARHQTREVLAGAYVRKNPVCLTHLVEVDADGFEIKTMCSKVKLDSICDSYGSDVEAKPTCPTCARKWDKLLAKGELNIYTK